MKIKFKPMLGLTIAVFICLCILLTLGTWQYKRLIWKTALIEQINEAAHNQPLSHLAQINAGLTNGEALDFRRVSLDLNFIEPSMNNGNAFHLMRSNGKSFSWRLYQPAVQNGDAAYVATREFTEIQKEKPPAMLVGERKIIGYVRLVQKANWTIPKSKPKINRWFAFNAAPEILNWQGDNNIQTSYYIDHVEQVSDINDLPVLIPELRNNHLDYMLTWYSFALILLIIYALIHKKNGRLGIERS
ncbi:MAG: hypothetical protein COA43_02905 [Robiginitomaculum sp.]|nr:MAG: hypothetical protein COA43_02905 [Robiginitomaculum sp.]